MTGSKRNRLVGFSTAALGGLMLVGVSGTAKATVLGQSPINIVSTETTPIDLTLQYNYHPSEAKVIYVDHDLGDEDKNDGQVLELEFHYGGGDLTYDGQTRKLRQFHFHSPSEHYLDGEQFALESHFVHQDDSAKTTVLGVPFSENPAYVDSAWNSFFSELVDTGGSANPNNWQLVPAGTELEDVDAGELLAEVTSFYAYSGSFTTTPFTEGVDWFVSEEALDLWEPYVDTYRRSLSLPTDRELQDLDGRRVYRGVQEGAAAVPEPTTLALMAIGLAGLLGTRRRKPAA